MKLLYQSMEPKKTNHYRVFAALFMAFWALGGATMFQSCEKDMHEGQPSWLGNSIYERLQDDGNYKITLRLIDDLDVETQYAQMLRQTGSKTLFVADDSTYAVFFKNNPWGVRRYDDLSLAQKKLIIRSAMVNNAYLIELLSNVPAKADDEEPLEGMCMRRESDASVYDSISRYSPNQMPLSRYWDIHRHKKDGIVLLRDNTSKPMIHFLPRFMTINNITSADLSKLTNGQSTNINDAWVNGKRIIEKDIVCKNGYIQKVDGVMLSSNNMADVLRQHPTMSHWSSLMDRYCAPYYDAEATKTYNRLYNNEDSVFVLHYFSQQKGRELNTAPQEQGAGVVDACLTFDPGWNQYMYTNQMGKDLHYDCGALLVPTNAALDEWWLGEGDALRDQYQTWDRVPDNVLVELINVNMVPEFVKTVPSKFKNITNDAKVEMGVRTEDIDSCFIACNGVVYLTNKVFAPATYSSVAFPALVHTETMNILWWAIDNLGFKPYLNSMDSYYSFICPTNKAMMRYVDPCSFGASHTVMYQFYYDDVKKKVGAHRYTFDLTLNDTIPGAQPLDDASDSQVKDRLTDIINNLIIVGNVEDGNQLYRTKGGAMVKVDNAGVAGLMTIAAGLQIEQGTPMTVTQIFDQTKNGNGKVYVVEGEVPTSGRKSVYKTLSEHSEYSRFFDLLRGSDPDYPTQALTAVSVDKHACVDWNINLFENYHYTVWVPTNESLDRMHEQGILPYWEDLEEQTDSAWGGNHDAAKAKKAQIRGRILDFLRYHIQDNSIFMGMGIVEGRYESGKLNPNNRKYYSLGVSANNSSITVSDLVGNVRHVVKQDGLFNQMCREYLFTSNDRENAAGGNIYSSSYAAVHLIDGPLFFNNEQLEPISFKPGE